MKEPIFESGMSFSFSADAKDEKIDGGRANGVVGLKLVDFIFRHKNDMVFLEVKGSMNTDFLKPGAKKDHEEFLDKVKNGSLAQEELIPKCRGTYLFMHLMDELDGKIPAFAVLPEPFDTADLMRIKDKMERLIAHEAPKPWKRKYAKLIGVFNRKTLNEVFKHTLTVS